MARHDIEIAVDLITEQIQSQIQQALIDVAVARADGVVTMEPPRQYFNYIGARCDKPPSVFVVPQDVDYRKDRGANFVYATATIFTAVVIEDKLKDLLAIKSWRYLAALLMVLDQIGLTSPDNQFSIKVIVRRSRFTEEFTDSTKPTNAAAMWRKGVELDLDVEFYEQLLINGGS